MGSPGSGDADRAPKGLPRQDRHWRQESGWSLNANGSVYLRALLLLMKLSFQSRYLNYHWPWIPNLPVIWTWIVNATHPSITSGFSTYKQTAREQRQDQVIYVTRHYGAWVLHLWRTIHRRFLFKIMANSIYEPAFFIVNCVNMKKRNLGFRVFIGTHILLFLHITWYLKWSYLVTGTAHRSSSTPWSMYATSTQSKNVLWEKSHFEHYAKASCQICTGEVNQHSRWEAEPRSVTFPSGRFS